MSELDSKTELEKQIQEHTSRVSSQFSGEFDEASTEGLAKYAVSCHESVELLEALASPVLDEKYLDNAPNSSLKNHLRNEEYGSIIDQATEKFTYLTQALYREGIL